MKPSPREVGTSTLSRYLSEIAAFPLLSQAQEQRLAHQYRSGGDLEAAHVLITSNLRFVVKVSYEYRSYGLRMADLIQEGNIGLMRAVQKFDPERGIRLISYAVWWIRAYIQNYILRSWSLVKLGTTQAQRKLFFSLGRARREIEKATGDGLPADARQIARRLRVKPAEVLEMEQRLEGRDLSLDAPLGDDGMSTHIDFVPSPDPGQDEAVAGREERLVISRHIEAALALLDPRERFIIERRAMSDQPVTLKELGQHFGFSRERARQLEIRAKEKLKHELAQLVAEIAPEGVALPPCLHGSLPHAAAPTVPSHDLGGSTYQH